MRQMTDQSVRAALLKRAAQAHVAAFTPHDLRRTYISNLLDAGVDLATAQGLAGHENANTTSGYDRRGDAAKKKAVELLHCPYFPRKGNQ